MLIICAVLLEAVLEICVLNTLNRLGLSLPGISHGLHKKVTQEYREPRGPSFLTTRSFLGYSLALPERVLNTQPRSAPRHRQAAAGTSDNHDAGSPMKYSPARITELM